MVRAFGIQPVGETYDRLEALVRDWRSMPSRSADEHGAATLLIREARLLDDRRFDEWIAGWADDGCLWVPLDGHAHPGDDQSFFLDDLRRLRERVGRWSEPAAWSLHPPSATIRQVTNVESAIDHDDHLRVRSVLTVFEQGTRDLQVWPMHQYHLFGDRDDVGLRRLRAKVLVVPALRHATPHTAVLL